MGRAKSKVEGGTAVRLLQDCIYGAANDVVTIPAKELASAKEIGLCDDNEAAVAYAKSLPQNAPEQGESEAAE